MLRSERKRGERFREEAAMKRIFGSARIRILSASAPALAETFARDDEADATPLPNLDGDDRRALRGWRGR
jgi:hypothetical protein